jgi:hypothetical protein
VRSGPGEARTILLFHIISARPSKQPLTVRTFLKVYMELGSYFLFLQEQIKDIIIISQLLKRQVQQLLKCQVLPSLRLQRCHRAHPRRRRRFHHGVCTAVQRLLNQVPINNNISLPQCVLTVIFRHEQAPALVQPQPAGMLKVRCGPRAVCRARLGAARQRRHWHRSSAGVDCACLPLRSCPPCPPLRPWVIV